MSESNAPLGPPSAPPNDVPPSEQVSPVASALPFFLALLLMFGIAYGGWTLWRVEQDRRNREQAIPLDYVGPPLTEFELTDRSGQPFRSADMRGRVWVATYFFTTCPGSCIRLNRNIQAMHNLPQLKEVTWVSITCDPDTDTLEELRGYADGWNADPERWLFCRADLEYTKRVAEGMNLYLSRQGHQDYAIVIDKEGNIRGAFDATTVSGCKRLQTLLLKCLEEKPELELAAIQTQNSNR